MEGNERRLRFFDAHAHLADPAFAGDLDEVLGRAEAAGVIGIAAVCETLQDAARILALADRHRIIEACAGLYPTILDRAAADAMEAFIREHRDRLVGIGEVGLDHWKVQGEAEREIQREILLRQIRLSLELDLPLNLHSRSAGRHAIEFLRAHGARRVLMHAFDGKASTALAGIEAGYFFSIPPSIVRSEQKRKLVRHLPLDRLLLESDSPVLGPAPGERNEPANVRIACEAIARIRGISLEAVAEATTENARRLFPRAFA